MTDVERYRSPVDSWIDVMGPVGQLSAHIAKTDFVPAAMRNRPDAVAAAILTGRELGLSPLTALRGINIIEGRPSLSAELLGARILAVGHKIEWLESTEKTATVHIQRADGLSDATVTWTTRDAERAGLTKKPNWVKYPRDMLRARALTEAARMACPDVALGLDTDATPEVQSAPNRDARTVTVQVAPRTASERPETPPTPEPEESSTDAPETVTETPTAAETVPEDPETDAPVLFGDPDPEAPEERINRGQIRRIHAIVRDMEVLANKRLDADEKRTFIVRHAGIDQPETVESLNDLTETQAGWAIASLQNAREMLRRERENDDQ